MTTRSFLLGLLLVVVVTAVPQSDDNFRCPETCPDSSQPVCSTDNVVFRNDCHLRMTACRRNTNIKKKHDGVCVSSRPSSSSASSSSACREECPKIYLPVCGSDGKTYSNKCLLDSASCKNANANRPRIDFQFEGECESAVEVSRDDCHRTCGNTYSPVCASNGNTYFNKCELSIATCRNSQITQRFEGVCAGTTSSSSAKRPSRDQRPASAPVVTDGCPTKCEGGFRPVCGTNNITYGSDCYLSIAMCKIPGLRKKDDGVCAKDCFLDCETTKNFVCGTNGVTYDNDCFLLLDRCKDPAVGFLHSGKCVPEEVEKCKRDRRSRCSSPRRSVCGSDGITYDSLCSLRVAACEKSWILRISDGPCQV